jgi:NAD(P)-dependent dehydrogenase (short-subunit alcohol dehydrogenase family)
MIKEKFNLNNKVAVITGASKGIGESIARGLAEFGANVVISSRKQEAVDEVASKFNSEGLSAIGIECHVAKEDHQKELIRKVMDKFGRIDILINNAGTNPYFGPVDKMSLNLYQKTMDINLNSAISLSNLVYPVMKKQGGGSIIHISSIEGIHPSKMMTAYNISKASLIMLGKNQAIEWGKDNIRVNMICPGYVKTKLSAGLLEHENSYKSFLKNVPLGRVSTPDEMAGLAIFLASDASSYMTGSSIVNDGGLLHAPLIDNV